MGAQTAARQKPASFHQRLAAQTLLFRRAFESKAKRLAVPTAVTIVASSAKGHSFFSFRFKASRERHFGHWPTP